MRLSFLLSSDQWDSVSTWGWGWQNDTFPILAFVVATARTQSALQLFCTQQKLDRFLNSANQERLRSLFSVFTFHSWHYYNNVDVFVIQNWLICLAFSVCHCQLKVSFFILLLLFPVVRIMSCLTEILGRDFRYYNYISISVTYSRCWICNVHNVWLWLHLFISASTFFKITPLTKTWFWILRFPFFEHTQYTYKEIILFTQILLLVYFKFLQTGLSWPDSHPS